VTLPDILQNIVYVGDGEDIYRWVWRRVSYWVVGLEANCWVEV